MERLNDLEKQFKKAKTAEDFGLDNIEELFALAHTLEEHANWMNSKPRRKDAKEIERLQKKVAENADIIQKIEAWSKKGILIEYIIIDQYENGYGKAVEKGEMPAFTYTVSVFQDGKDLFQQSFDFLEEALSAGLAFVEKKFGSV